MPRSRLAPAPASYDWMFDLLVGRTSAVSWAPEGKLPQDFVPAERFVVLPAGGGSSFMVSLTSRAGSAAALTSYNALRTPRRRLARSVLSLGLRAGGVQRLSEKVEIGLAAGTPAGDVADELLTEHLRARLERDRIVVAFGGGTGPYRKPVLQVFTPDGRPVAYVKVGWNDWTTDAVRREAAALRACVGRPMRLGVPELVDHYSWRGLDLLITAPMPAGVVRMSRQPQLPPVSLLREISELGDNATCPLAGSAWWRDIRTRIGTRITDPAARAALAAVADEIERSGGQAVLEFGRWHGDLVPWNLARLGRRVYAWDWESSAADAPVGFDALHFFFQVAFVEQQVPLDAAVTAAARQAQPALAGLGARPEVQGLLARLHLLELAVRHEEARASTGDCDGRFYPAILTLLSATASDALEPAT